MDHGLETAEERRSLGKDPRGCINLKLVQNNNRLRLIYTDDGRGLNLSKLRQIAKKNNLINASEHSDAAKVVSCIFKEGVSTSREITDISGRGVGMGAVKQYIEDKGGSIEIALKNNNNHPGDFVDFEFILSLPERFFIKRGAI